jgi:hypothetical protein
VRAQIERFYGGHTIFCLHRRVTGAALPEARYLHSLTSAARDALQLVDASLHAASAVWQHAGTRREAAFVSSKMTLVAVVIHWKGIAAGG